MRTWIGGELRFLPGEEAVLSSVLSALQARLGTAAFLRPSVLGWLLVGGYRETGDRNLSGLATPARVSLWTIIGGLAMAGALWLAAVVAGAA